MSEENVELVNRAYAAMSRNDLQGFLSVLLRGRVPLLDCGVGGDDIPGPRWIRDWWEQVKGALGGLRFEAEAIRVEGDWAVVKVLVTGRIGDATVPQRMWQAVRARSGKAVWWSTYRTEAEALEAAGLSE